MNQNASDIPALDVAEVVGPWINTEPPPVAIARVAIERGDGPPRIHTFGIDPDDRGGAVADGLYAAGPAGREAVALTAAYEGPEGGVELHANVSKGLLIVSSFRRHPGGSGRPRAFAREFFRRMPELPRQPPADARESRAAGRHAEGPKGPGGPSRDSIFHGRWRNTQRNPSLLASLTFSAGAGPLSLRAEGLAGVGRQDPGAFDAELLIDGPDAVEPSKILGWFGLGDRDVRLHGWVKQEVLVLAYFAHFTAAGDRSDYFDREFFHREG